MRTMSMRDTLNDWLPALLKAAEQGCTDSMGILGFMYTDGFGVEKDEAKGRYWFEREKNSPQLSDSELDRLDKENPWMTDTATPAPKV